MTDAKETDDRKRAAALADEIEAGRLAVSEAANPYVVIRDAAADLVSALRAYAAPAVSADLRERVARAIREAPMRRTLNGPRIIDPTIELTENELLNADAALAAISAAGYVICPREVHEQMKDALRDILKRNEIQHWFCTEKQRAALAAAEAGHEA